LDPATCGQAEGHGTCTNTPGSYYCNCSQYYHEFNCDVYLPRRHCADLKRYFNLSFDGPTTFAPPYDTVGYAAYDERPVYCINSNNSGIGDGRGGYTVVNYFEANGSAGWRYDQYAAGFGNVPSGNYWTGLSLMSGMTRLEQTSMFLLIEDCANQTFNCLYPSFVIGSSSDRFPLNISEMCTGTAFATYDGEHDPLVPWLPEFNNLYPFTALPDPAAVAKLGTGFWYGDEQISNLNGLRDNCMRGPGYLKYGIRYYKQARMFLRPLGYWDSA